MASVGNSLKEDTTMNASETATVAAQERQYQKSAQSVLDRLMDRKKRADLDIANGHSPLCSLTKCHKDCTKK